MQTLNIGGRACVRGLDWSHWQAPRDMHQAAAEGFEFAAIKATEGDAYRDPSYVAHVNHVVDAGLMLLTYHFARPDWSDGSPEADGAQEARFLLDAMDPRTNVVVLDFEASPLNADQTRDYGLGFWREIQASGRFPIRETRIQYVGRWFGYTHAKEFRDAACLWVPSYTDPNYPAPNPNPEALPLPSWSSDLWDEGWCIWQYTDNGTAGGAHPSDCNVATVTWLESARAGTSMTHEAFTPQEDDMPRPVYKFPDGHPDPWAGTLLIDLRHGAHPTPEGVGYGPHWYLTNADTEVRELIDGREINPGMVRTFASGDDLLDEWWVRFPKVPAGTVYTAPGGTIAMTDVEAIANQVAAKVKHDISTALGG